MPKLLVIFTLGADTAIELATSHNFGVASDFEMVHAEDYCFILRNPNGSDEKNSIIFDNRYDMEIYESDMFYYLTGWQDVELTSNDSQPMTFTELAFDMEQFEGLDLDAA